MSERPGSEESFVDKRQVPEADATDHVASESLALEHEVQEVNLRALLLFSVSLVAVVVVIALVLWSVLRAGTDRAFDVRVQIPPADVTPQTGPGPGVEPFPERERETVAAPALERINTYGWVDREAGTVHIPIDEAKKRLIEQGAPAADSPVPQFGLDPAYELDSTGGQGRGETGEE
jgi:hypothetical protein